MQALITGASSGIGLELAKEFARHNYDLILVSKDAVKLAQAAKEIKAIAKINVKTIVIDLASPNASEKIFAQAKHVDVLINNAGFGSYGPFSKTSLPLEKDMIQVNMLAPTALTKLFLKEMIAKKKGKILMVASVAAFMPGPYMAVYYATKAYVLSLTQAIAAEIKGSGVTIGALCPGPVKTNFTARANISQNRLFSGHIIDAQTVAKRAYKGLMAGKRVIFPQKRHLILIGLTRILPQRLIASIVARIQQGQ